MAKVTMGSEHTTTIPKFKRCKVSAVRDFPPGCRRGATMDLGLHRQITADQGKYSLSISDRMCTSNPFLIVDIEPKSCECSNTRMKVIDTIPETP
ncbi:hypothetical protein J1N35_029032 [Gossypium stocksii]|uniref:Uncharacterized protein n=1 Tax=Gossypium stocksii TaxID=47602 RepID=A0A9D3ZT52_9ROSI|nr:hypothetical protein J1N35_029032 [Gossypium stocksii]